MAEGIVADVGEITAGSNRRKSTLHESSSTFDNTAESLQDRKIQHQLKNNSIQHNNQNAVNDYCHEYESTDDSKEQKSLPNVGPLFPQVKLDIR